MIRIIAIAIIFSHLLSSVGLSMRVHYCGSHKFYSLCGLEFGSKCSCDHENHIHKNDCCKDKKVEVKAIKKENINRKVVTLINVLSFDLISICSFNKVQPFQSLVCTILYKGRPPNYSPPLFVLNRVFRI